MRRALTSFALVCALGGCEFVVNLGTTVPPPVGTFGGGPGVNGCSNPQLVAYEVTLESTPIPKSCWLEADQQLTLGEERFVAVFLTAPTSPFLTSGPPSQTMAVVGLEEQPMGDAAPVKPGEAFAGTDTVFPWEDSVRYWQTYGGAANTLNTSARFSFDRLDTAVTAGTMQLRSEWWCQPDADGGCPPPLSASAGDAGLKVFASACQYERHFFAQRTEVPAGWVSEPQELIPGAQQFIASLDTGALEEVGSICWGSAQQWLVERHVPGLRRVERWQFDPSTSTLSVPRRTLNLGDGPAIAYGPTLTLASNPEARVEVTAGPDAIEQRVTRLVVNSSICTFGALDLYAKSLIGFESEWRCMGAGCSTVPGTDHGACQGSFEFFTIPFDPFVSVSP